jgi:hypothetical protein
MHALTFHWIRPNDGTCGLTDEHFAQVKRVIANGLPVAAGSYHSILLVGYVDDPSLAGGGHFFVRDSGGGNGQTLTYAAAKARMCDLFWVEAAGGASAQVALPTSRGTRPSVSPSRTGS